MLSKHFFFRKIMESAVLENLFISCYKHIYNRSIRNSQQKNIDQFQSNLNKWRWPFYQFYEYSTLLFSKLSTLTRIQQQQQITNVCFLFEMNLSRFCLDSHHLLQHYHDALIDIVICNLFPIGYFQQLQSENHFQDSVLLFFYNEEINNFVWKFLCYIPTTFYFPNNNDMDTSIICRDRDTFIQFIRNKLLSKVDPQFIPIVYQQSDISQQIDYLQVHTSQNEYFQKSWTILDIPLLLTQCMSSDSRYAMDFADACLVIDQTEWKQFQSSVAKGIVPKVTSTDKYLQTCYSLNDSNQVIVLQHSEMDMQCICCRARTVLLYPTAYQIEVVEYLIYLREWIIDHLCQFDTIQSVNIAIQSKMNADGKQFVWEHLHPFILIPNTMSSIFIHQSMAIPMMVQKELLASIQLQCPFQEEEEEHSYHSLQQNMLIHLCYKTDSYSIVLCDTYLAKVKTVITPIKRSCDYLFPKSSLSLNKYEYNNNNNACLIHLPNEIHIYLSFYFEIQELVSYYCTCKVLHQLFVTQVNPSQQMVWKEMVLRYFLDTSLKNSFGFTKRRFNSHEETNQDTKAEYEYDKMVISQEMDKLHQVDWRYHFIAKQKLIVQFQSIQTVHCVVCGDGEEQVFEKLLPLSGMNRFKSLSINNKRMWNGYLKELTNSCSIEIQSKQIIVLQKRKPIFCGERYYNSPVHVVVYAFDVTDFETDYKRLYRQFHDTFAPFYKSCLQVLVVLVNYNNSKRFHPYDCFDLSFNTQASKNVNMLTTVMSVLRLEQMGRCLFYQKCKASICVLDDFIKEFKKCFG